MKKGLCLLLVAMVLLGLSGCGEPKILHCDSCGQEVKVDNDSKMEEEWIVYCEECNEKLLGDDPILGDTDQ